MPVNLAHGPGRGVDQLQPGRDLPVVALGRPVVAGHGKLPVTEPERVPRGTGNDLCLGRWGPPAGQPCRIIRIDDDLLQWFRKQVRSAGGGSYQTLINAALREYVGTKREPLEATLRRVLLRNYLAI